MPGTRIFSKKSRIFRIIAVILPLPLLLLSFLMGAVEVSADSGFPSSAVSALGNITVGYENSACTYVSLRDRYSTAGSLTDNGTGYNYSGYEVPAGAIGYYEGIVNFYTSTIQSEYAFDATKSYYGYFRYNLGFSLRFNNSISGADYSNLVIEDIWSSSNDFNYMWSANADSSSISRTGTMTITRNFKVGETYRLVVRDNFIIKFRVYVFYYSTAMSDPISSNPVLDLTSVPSGQNTKDIVLSSNFVRVTERENYYLYNINENIKGQASAINQASQQNSQDLNKIDDHLMNDNSGFSSGVDSAKSEFESQEAVANQAMDGAVHNYNGHLDTVQDMDFDNFWTNQSNTALFWRDVGEFILDPSNLGMFAGGLVIVSVMTLFVFMLRL